MANAHHLLGLHMHQPAGNLLELLRARPDKAHKILLAYERPLNYAEKYRTEARFCVSFSGVLLEQLADQEVAGRYAEAMEARSYLVRAGSHVVDIGRMLERYRRARNIEIAGTGHYHPLFPVIPDWDWDEHIERGRRTIREILGREPELFWPPEGGVTARMIPRLADRGYKYLIVEDRHVRAREGSPSKQELCYRTHLAEHDGKSIVVVSRDRALSDAQHSGVAPDEFAAKVRAAVHEANFTPLVTTWTDGENGGWFLEEHEPSNFWGRFFEPYLLKIRAGQLSITTAVLAEYAAGNPPHAQVDVETGTWAYIWEKEKIDPFYRRWAELPEQRAAIDRIWQVSRRWLGKLGRKDAIQSESQGQALRSAREHLLRAEASDNLFHGRDWLPRLHDELDQAERLLGPVEELPGSLDAP